MSLVPNDFQDWLRPFLAGTRPWGDAHFGDDSLPEVAKPGQQLLEEKRIEQAKNYLANCDLKIDAVATLCGYTGATYFIRTFRKLTGQSPGQWRLQPAGPTVTTPANFNAKKLVDKGL